MTSFHMSRGLGRNLTQIRNDAGLDDAIMMQVAPSIFAVEAHESRSSRYAYIPTSDVLAGLRREGFVPVMAAQARCRDEGKRDFTKHMIRMRHAGQGRGEGEANEIILLNSHDGTSSYQMVAGMFRFVCANGLVVGDVVEDFKVRHSGNVIDNVIEGAYTVLDQFEQVQANRDDMRAIILPEPAQRALATAAIGYRWETEEGERAPVTPDQVLRARRSADAGNDLWSTFNRLQENMVKGGLRGVTANGQRRATRAVTGISQDVKLNRALWTLAEGLKDMVKSCEI